MTEPRVGVVSVWHETNGYSRRLAALDAWRDYELADGDAVAEAHRGTRSVVGGFLDGLGERAVPVFAAGAWPSGPAPAEVFDALLDGLTAALSSAGRLDAIALNLHGAMVVDGTDDAESAIVERIRSIVGDVPIAAVLDLHGNPSVELAAAVDAIVGYRTYPHVDMWECGRTAVELIDRMLAGERVVTTIAKLPLLTAPLAQATDGPLGDALAAFEATASDAGILRASVFAGFAYQDVARAGFSVVAVSRADDAVAARAATDAAAADLARRHAAGAFEIVRPTPADAVATALAADEVPVVLVDVADNIGAGSAGDGTVLLAELLAADATGAVVAIADREVAALAHEAGHGAELDVRIGGKVDDLHGPALDVRGRVARLTDGRYTTTGSWATGQSFDMGPTAVLEAGGVTIVVTTHATPPFHREHLTSAGVDPAAARILVAKSAVAWRSAYGDDARTVIEVDAPGACPIDPWSLPRRTRPAGTPAVTPRLGRPTSTPLTPAPDLDLLEGSR
ncbi:M81 family metallopeptidase [Agromyces silvae]|uniref:M81 family metallopeptidase n=1 Tax=Agromyces silvae TaxID=3388266 RepID=UPI00280A858F|nr:M81 family metallopeptidase [Agromyces protaetiae]